jgi:hypothetical protein
MRKHYFFPCLGINLKFDEPVLEFEKMAVHRRLRSTSTFDLATLSTRHTLHIPYQLMDVYLASCNAEIELRDANDFEGAADELEILRMLFYAKGIAPFLIPFCTTYSVNAYSGINSRDSEALRKDLAPEMQEGLASDSGTLEAWPVDMSLLLLQTSHQQRDLTPATCEWVGSTFALWTRLEKEHLC